MRIRTKILGVVTLAALLLTVVSFTNGRAGAQSTRAATEIGGYGMVGITSGQTARLNVYIPPGPPSRESRPGLPLRVQLSLMDANGNLAVQSSCDPRSVDCVGGSQTSVMLSPGQSAFLDVSGDQMVGALSRVEIRPVVNLYLPPGPPCVPASAIITTFEIIDNATNRTVLLYHPPGPCRESRGSE